MNEREYLTLLKVLRDLLRSGASLTVGASELASSKHLSPKLRQVFKVLAERLAEGVSIDKALESAGGLPPTFLAILSAGTQSGRLVELLDEEISEVENYLTLKREFLGVMLYPTFQVFLVSCGLIGLWAIMRFVASSLVNSGFCPDRLGFIGFVYKVPLWAVVIFSLLIVALWLVTLLLLYRSIGFLRIAPIGPLRKLAIGRALKALGLILSAGLPWSTALFMVRRATDVLPETLEHPKQLIDLLKDSTAEALISTAIQTGELEKALTSLGETYISQGMNALKATVRMTTIVTLVVSILALGGLVGYIAISFLSSLANLPVY